MNDFATATADATPTVGISRLAGVGLRVSDLDRSADFYVGLLGLKAIMRVPVEGVTREIVLSLSGDIGDTLLVLTKLDDKPLNIDRSAFGRVIMNATDAAKVAARVREAGFGVSQLAAQANGPVVFFAHDPDGYHVELFQTPKQA